ncbi:MAG: YfjI family protein [Actinomycetota bacterium]|nr:YfjI family protein [Actinomycetota bacterium]
MSAPGRPLRAVPAPHHPGDDPCDDVEALAAAEVARAREALPEADPAVFDCYLGALVRQIAPDTEADPIAILVSLLAAAGVHLGPGPHVQIGDDRHPLLIWPLVIGRSAAGRKGASWSTTRRLLTTADAEFVTTNIRSGLTSGEGLAAVFTPDHPHPDASPDRKPDTRPAGPGALPAGDPRLLVYEPEWAAVMARMKREGNALSATLRAAWEGGDLSTMNVTARIARGTHIGILAHISPTEFRTKVSVSDMAGGTYNRFLPIAVARSQFLPLAPGIPAALLADTGFDLATRLLHGAGTGALSFTPDATRTWRRLYVEFGTDHGDDGPIGEFIARTAPYCLRIAGLHATLDGHPHIDTHHLTAAAALVRYAIASARSVFSTEPVTAKLATWIAAAGPDGRTRKEITAGFFQGKTKSADIQLLLDELVAAGRVEMTLRPRPDGRPGKPSEVYTQHHPGELSELSNSAPHLRKQPDLSSRERT